MVHLLTESDAGLTDLLARHGFPFGGPEQLEAVWAPELLRKSDRSRNDADMHMMEVFALGEESKVLGLTT
jgi:hypothetical protein